MSKPGEVSHCLGWMCCEKEKKTATHIIEEAGFLSLLLSNRGSHRTKSPWWQADVELGVVGGKERKSSGEMCLCQEEAEKKHAWVFIFHFWMC